MNKIKPFEQLSNKEWEYYLNFLVSELGSTWLNKDSSNPVQLLWKRSDYPASQELYILAKAMVNLKNIDKICYDTQLKKIKSKDYNTSKGHCFEVIALSYFQNNYKMHPTAKGEPGVDATMEYSNTEINWSFKNFGISKAQIDFENKSKKIENISKNLFSKKKVYNFDLSIIFTQYPSTKDIWDKLEQDIVKSIQQYCNIPIINGNETLNYCYKICNINDEKLSYNQLSYTFKALCPYYKNEEKNFCSKLDDAVTNLLEHSSLKDKNKVLKNALLVHIPETIDISSCVEWGQKYLENSKINILSFYQTYIAQTEETSGIYHAWQCLNKDLILPTPMCIEVPVGIITNETLGHMIVSTETELKNFYVYQHGNIYKNSIITTNGTITSNLESVAMGIKTNTVVSFPNSNQSFIITPKIFSPDNKLLII